MHCDACGDETPGPTCPTCAARTESRSPSDQLLANWPRRLGGSLVDWFVLYLVLLVCSVVANYVVSVTIFSVAAAGYLVGLIATERGQTLGCIAANTKVRSLKSGGRATLAQSTRRFIAFAVPLIVTMVVFVPPLEIVLWLYLVVDVLFPLWDRRRQTLHDKWAGTVVVVALPGDEVSPQP